MTYADFVCELLRQKDIGEPIYTSQIAKALGQAVGLNEKDAAAATAVALKRIMDRQSVPNLRCYQKGIYYRAAATPFGELGINKEKLIADKYLLPDIGYETGLTLLHSLGLTSQMPKDRVIASNMASDCARYDRKLDVTVRPAKTAVTSENKGYLQMLDALDMLEKAPVDAERPYAILAQQIHRRGLQYERLLSLADQFYNRNTVLQLAHTASEGGYA